MKREIKFRAWDGKRMLFTDRDQFYLIGNEVDIPSHTGHEFYRKDYPIMQFTGLTDSEDKDIYEGDIVKYVSLEDENRVGVITYRDGAWRLLRSINPNVPIYDAEVRMWNDGCHNWYSIENIDEMKVVGNVYETPNAKLK